VKRFFANLWNVFAVFNRLILLFLCLYPLIIASRLWFTHKQNRKPKSILILAAFWEGNAGYEYRVARWAEILRQEGYTVDIHTAYSESEFNRWVNNNAVWLYIKPAWRRFLKILRSSQYELVIVRREVLIYNEYGNLFLERLLLKLHPHAILDFDDDLTAAKSGLTKESVFGKLLLQTPDKFGSSVSLYRYFLPGSPFLADRFLSQKQQQDKASSKIKYLVLPTCVDYDHDLPRDYSSRPVSSPAKLGWIGSVGNLYLLDHLIPALDRLNTLIPIELVVISGLKYDTPANFAIQNIPWSMATQLESLRSIDIGLMPLLGDNKDSGKCGFKLIQYMGIGIVSAASAIGVNGQIVQDDVNGFLVAPGQDWCPILYATLKQTHRFAAIGESARQTIRARYSFSANQQPFLQFLEHVRAGVA